jgi:hypothetical protein
MRMNESLQKAWDEFMKSDEFANAMLAGSFAPPEYLETFHDRVPHGPRGRPRVMRKKEREARGQ